MIDFSEVSGVLEPVGSQSDSAAWEFDLQDAYGLSPSKRSRVAAEVLQEYLNHNPEFCRSSPRTAGVIASVVEGLQERVRVMERTDYDRLSFSASEASVAELIVKTATGGTQSLKSSSTEDTVVYLQLARDLRSVPDADSRSVASMIAQIRYGKSLLELETEGSRRIAAMLLALAEQVGNEIRETVR